MDITDTLRRIHAGDRQAFAAVVNLYQGSLFGFLGRMGLDQAHAEDLAQETFIRAWQNLGRYRQELGAFSTWLFTIARNLALNELARAAHARELPPNEDTPEPACEEPGPEAALAAKQLRRRLQRVLRQMPLGDRSVLALAYTHELELSAIAQIEGCSTGAVKTRLHRARQKLRGLLGTDYE